MRTDDDDEVRTVRRDEAPPPVRALRVRTLAPLPTASVDGDELTVGSAERNDLVVALPTVSRFHLELRRAASGILARDLGSTNGSRVGSVLFRDSEVILAPGTTIELGDAKVIVEEASTYLAPGVGPAGLGKLLGRSTAMRTLTTKLSKAAASGVSILLTGESGTGKELAARAIHDHSSRAERPFVTVDCGAIAPSLFASELFGHERGAFTGADRRHVGAFERAHHGTLFLDEVGELGPELQAALLGALERRRIRRVGGASEVPVDVRVVSATHRDLRAMVNEGAFRLDLFFRLAAVRISMPSLRDRPEDVPLLIQHFLREVGREAELPSLFTPETLASMAGHRWPGNVRELRNVVLGALALGEPPLLEDAPATPLGDLVGPLLALDYATSKRKLLDAFERRWLLHRMAQTGGNVRAAAREGNIERKHLIELLRRHGIKTSTD